ncbi:sensor domain-containing diguanylate cyclase [Petrocella sp. FN5]|uniref:sensor domain-containing diguanylate cyclase n=1 Tax=Petrocella sp. FN5 TaxID=3032002 RepID=UPI0023DBD159|nr:sensor domain-containing diguanylate cyclase [Petrocella sp. FN5]MDF1618276.1 sensor domain-containing diguanylate cyclase [Petrocella sp. FN5]
MDRILNYEQKILKRHTLLIIILLFYVLFCYFDKRELAIPFWGMIIFITITISRLILMRINYGHKLAIYKVANLLYMTLYAYYIHDERLIVQGLSILLFFVNFIELIVILEPETPSEKGNLLWMGALPLVISGFVSTILTALTIEIIIYWGILWVVLYFVLNSLADYVYEQKKIFANLNIEIQKNKVEKESLEIEKIKYKKLHHVLLTQKQEIEKKNIELNRVSSEMYTQSELLRYISSVLDIDELIGLVADSIIGAIGVDTCMLYVLDEGTNEKFYKVNTVIEYDFLESFKTDIEKGVYSRFYENGKPFMDSNVDIHEYPFIQHREVGSLIIVPLVKSDQVYGLLIAEHHTKDMFDHNSMNFFKSIISQINIAINNANLYSKMEEIAIRDGLTGLYNREHIQSIIIEAIDHIEKDDVLSLALLDIDRFKKINDTYGHLFGDEVIKAVSKIIQRIANEHDGHAGRYGGEEFLVVLPKKNLKEAEAIVTALHEEIKALEIIYKGSAKVKVDTSIGLSALPTVAKDVESLLHRADNAMYYSKNHGRGRLIVDHENLLDSL